MDSKFNAGDAKADFIQFRAYVDSGVEKPNITITPYADIYATVSYANGRVVAKRAKRNEQIIIENPFDTSEKESYDNEYDKEILTRTEGNEDYKIIKIKVGISKGHLIAIYKPEKVSLIRAKKFNVGTYGEQVTKMCNRYNGLVCINGGGFVDHGRGSDIPLGYVIENEDDILGNGCILIAYEDGTVQKETDPDTLITIFPYSFNLASNMLGFLLIQAYSKIILYGI